jgi:hypothetical protein
MKKLKLDSMGLDKATIAKLDNKQLEHIVGGKYAAKGHPSDHHGRCVSGGTTCNLPVSTGCGAGGSACGIKN